MNRLKRLSGFAKTRFHRTQECVAAAVRERHQSASIDDTLTDDTIKTELKQRLVAADVDRAIALLDDVKDETEGADVVMNELPDASQLQENNKKDEPIIVGEDQPGEEEDEEEQVAPQRRREGRRPSTDVTSPEQSP